MPSITYYRPASVAEAARLAAADPDARLIAGGQSVLPAMKLGLLMPSSFIDLAGLGDLRSIRAERGNVSIGAMVTHTAVVESREIRAALPALSALAEGIGDAQVRNCGTIEHIALSDAVWLAGTAVSTGSHDPGWVVSDTRRGIAAFLDAAFQGASTE